ncbi:Shprh, partial [Symbiodinium pilosum]
SSCAGHTTSAASIPSRQMITEWSKCGRALAQDGRYGPGCGQRRRLRMLVGASKSARDSRSREKLLPIAPKANRSFFENSEPESNERVVVVRETKVKLSLSGSRRSVLAQPETQGCPTCGYRLTVSWSCPHCRGRDGGAAEVRKHSSEEERASPTRAPGPGLLSSSHHFDSSDQGSDGLGVLSPSGSFAPPGSGSGTKGSPVKEDSSRACAACGASTAPDADSCRRCGHKRPAGTVSVARASMITTEDVRADVFGKLQEHGELHCDELPRGLELCGFVGIKKEWVQSVRDSVTKYSTLELEEFLEFVRGYEALQEKAYKEAFEEADLDRSGTVESAELAE